MTRCGEDRFSPCLVEAVLALPDVDAAAAAPTPLSDLASVAESVSVSAPSGPQSGPCRDGRGEHTEAVAQSRPCAGACLVARGRC